MTADVILTSNAARWLTNAAIYCTTAISWSVTFLKPLLIKTFSVKFFVPRKLSLFQECKVPNNLIKVIRKKN